MPVTLEEARTLDAFNECRTIAKTAEKLKKANSAVVYALDSLEQKTGVKIFDRSGYRTYLNPAGEKVLEACRKLLLAKSEFNELCLELGQGWETEITIVFEGIYPIQKLMAPIKRLSEEKVPTRFHLHAEFLGEVEKAFLEKKADLMISVLAPKTLHLESVKLEEINVYLVAHKDHPLCKLKKKNETKDLESYPLLTVRGSDPRLNTPTAFLESKSTIQLNDFHSKKVAILEGLGFSWLPEYLIEKELKSGLLKKISWSNDNKHVFAPRLFYKKQRKLGKALQALVS